jgi:hypothetical protein
MVYGEPIFSERNVFLNPLYNPLLGGSKDGVSGPGILPQMYALLSQ